MGKIKEKIRHISSDPFFIGLISIVDITGSTYKDGVNHFSNDPINTSLKNDFLNIGHDISVAYHKEVEKINESK